MKYYVEILHMERAVVTVDNVEDSNEALKIVRDNLKDDFTVNINHKNIEHVQYDEDFETCTTGLVEQEDNYPTKYNKIKLKKS